MLKIKVAGVKSYIRINGNLHSLGGENPIDSQLCPLAANQTSTTETLSPAGLILTLDLGTQTGWAIGDKSISITSGTISFKPNRFEGGGMRYLRFANWLDELQGLVGGVSEVYFEEVRRHLGVDAAHAYGGFLAHLTSWCEGNKIPYLGVPVGSIKRHITGKGNAGKQEVMEAVKAKGFNPTDDNEADAIALLDLILTQKGEKHA